MYHAGKKKKKNLKKAMAKKYGKKKT